MTVLMGSFRQALGVVISNQSAVAFNCHRGLLLIGLAGGIPEWRIDACQCYNSHMEYLKLGVHIWVSVLIMGTMWRLVSYHLIASPNESLVHLGRAMAQQY